jgi:uncharacterized damage-inducible protein DinB
MPNSADPIRAVFRLNTDLVVNCLAGVDDATAWKQVTGDTNHMAFVLAHLITARHLIADAFGSPLPSPLEGVMDRATKVADVTELPPVDELLGHWLAVSAHLSDALAQLPDEALAESTRMRFPIEGDTRLSVLAFWVQHDSYHVGQLALLRRQLGLAPMTYARRAT